MSSPHPTDIPPDPASGWSRSIIEIPNATVVAPETAHFRQNCGVFDQQNTYCPLGATWRNGNRMTLHPKAIPEVQDQIPGRWLWGGVLFNHFGHFMIESTSRLWAIDNFDKPISGVIFVNKRPRAPTDIGGYRRQFINLLFPDLPIYVAKRAAKFENLVVAGQGLGLGEIAKGIPELRGCFHQRLSKSVSSDGPEKLYVSRSKLPITTSGLLGEQKMEQYLEDEGYSIFHPQDHSVDVQIARYRAAEEIIIADGSAAHLISFVCRADQKIAYIVRRSDWSEGPIEQLQSFRGKSIVVVDALKREWHPKNASAYKHIRFGELDMPRVSDILQRTDFIGQNSTWEDLSKGETEGVLKSSDLLDDFTPQ